MSFDIRIVTPQNADCLRSVAVDVFDATPRPEFWTGFLAAANHALIVAIHGGEVIGQARGVVHCQPDAPPDLYIDNLGVTPDWKRRGVATRLVRALIDWGNAQGAEVAWVATEVDNEEARGFYAAFGFSGQTMAYYVRE